MGLHLNQVILLLFNHPLYQLLLLHLNQVILLTFNHPLYQLLFLLLLLHLQKRVQKVQKNLPRGVAAPGITLHAARVLGVTYRRIDAKISVMDLGLIPMPHHLRLAVAHGVADVEVVRGVVQANKIALVLVKELGSYRVVVLISDNETPWMKRNNEDCTTSSLIDTKCNKNPGWRQKKYCRLSCYEAGNGYSGDICCDT